MLYMYLDSKYWLIFRYKYAMDVVTILSNISLRRPSCVRTTSMRLIRWSKHVLKTTSGRPRRMITSCDDNPVSIIQMIISLFSSESDLWWLWSGILHEKLPICFSVSTSKRASVCTFYYQRHQNSTTYHCIVQCGSTLYA